MAIFRLSGARANSRAVSEGSATVNDASTTDTGLGNITGGGMTHVGAGATGASGAAIAVASVAAGTITWDVLNSVGTALTVLQTVFYAFYGRWRTS